MASPLSLQLTLPPLPQFDLTYGSQGDDASPGDIPSLGKLEHEVYDDCDFPNERNLAPLVVSHLTDAGIVESESELNESEIALRSILVNNTPERDWLLRMIVKNPEAKELFLDLSFSAENAIYCPYLRNKVDSGQMTFEELLSISYYAYEALKEPSIQEAIENKIFNLNDFLSSNKHKHFSLLARDSLAWAWCLNQIADNPALKPMFFNCSKQTSQIILEPFYRQDILNKAIEIEFIFRGSQEVLSVLIDANIQYLIMSGICTTREILSSPITPKLIQFGQNRNAWAMCMSKLKKNPEFKDLFFESLANSPKVRTKPANLVLSQSSPRDQAANYPSTEYARILMEIAPLLAHPVSEVHEAATREVDAVYGEEWADFDTLIYAIIGDNEYWIKRSLKSMRFISAIPIEQIKAVWQALLIKDDPKQFESFFSYNFHLYPNFFVDLLENQNPELLNIALEEMRLSDHEIKSLFEKSLELGSIGCSLAIASRLPSLDQEKLASKLLFHDIDSSDEEALKDRLNLLFYQSSIHEISYFLKLVSNLSLAENVRDTIRQAIKEYDEWGPYVAHYVSRNNKSCFQKNYIQTEEKSDAVLLKEYIKHQVEYGKKMHRSVVLGMERFKERSLKETISNFSFFKVLSLVSKGLELEDFSSLREKRPGIEFRTFLQRNLDIYSTQKISPTRYSTFYSTLSKISKKIQLDSANGKEVRCALNEKAFTYTLHLDGEIESTTCKLERVAGSSWRWMHTKAENIAKVWSKLENHYLDLKDFVIDKAEPSSIQAFTNLLARTYFIGANQAPYFRGSAQYYQNWLIMMCRIHNLAIPMPTATCPQLDCIALSTPQSEFVANYSKYHDQFVVDDLLALLDKPSHAPTAPAIPK
jgi:hypothetical protein